MYMTVLFLVPTFYAAEDSQFDSMRERWTRDCALDHSTLELRAA